MAKKKAQEVRPGDIVLAPMEVRTITISENTIILEGTEGQVHRLVPDQEIDLGPETLRKERRQLPPNPAVP